MEGTDQSHLDRKEECLRTPSVWGVSGSRVSVSTRLSLRLSKGLHRPALPLVLEWVSKDPGLTLRDPRVLFLRPLSPYHSGNIHFRVSSAPVSPPFSGTVLFGPDRGLPKVIRRRRELTVVPRIPLGFVRSVSPRVPSVRLHSSLGESYPKPQWTKGPSSEVKDCVELPPPVWPPLRVVDCPVVSTTRLPEITEGRTKRVSTKSPVFRKKSG